MATTNPYPDLFQAGKTINVNDPRVIAALKALNPSGVIQGGTSGVYGAPSSANLGGASLGDLYGEMAKAQYLTNPGYLASIGADKKARTDSASAYLEALKPILLQYGSSSMARSVMEKLAPTLEKYLGYKPDLESYLSSFGDSENPDTSLSTLAQLKRQMRETGINTREAYNKRNLFYGGHYLKAQADDAYANQVAQNNALLALQEKQQGLGQNFLSALTNADTADAQAARDAYGQELSAALQYGTGYGTTDAGTTPTAPDMNGGYPPSTPAPTGQTPAGNPGGANYYYQGGGLPASNLNPGGVQVRQTPSTPTPDPSPTGYTAAGPGGPKYIAPKAPAPAKPAPVKPDAAPTTYYIYKTAAQAAAKPGQTVKFTNGRYYLA